MNESRIYLDFNASTPLAPEVIEAISYITGTDIVAGRTNNQCCLGSDNGRSVESPADEAPFTPSVARPRAAGQGPRHPVLRRRARRTGAGKSGPRSVGGARIRPA
jgi:hypothetical protein